jgi:hypothetical protein
MRSSTIINLVLLADQILKEEGQEGYQISLDEFHHLLDMMYQRISWDGRYAVSSKSFLSACPGGVGSQAGGPLTKQTTRC